jgi:hypothetical protein
MSFDVSFPSPSTLIRLSTLTGMVSHVSTLRKELEILYLLEVGGVGIVVGMKGLTLITETPDDPVAATVTSRSGRVFR